jgi:crotonobetainyl-CoA:carnitine CoA-transferase CaiB-like acyl-CoA transferase
MEDKVEGDRPLTGMRVLAIEHLQAMPYATQLFSWMGAEVIKVEPLQGESSRTGLPMLRDSDGEDVGSTYLRNNLSKRSMCIDLKQQRGVELVYELAASCDVLAENLRPGVLDRLGLSYDAVHARLPSLVYASVSGFGHDEDSPYAGWPAYAPIVETMAGFYELRRTEDSFPHPMLGGAFGDICAAMFSAVGILSAMRYRDRTGIGQHVDVAMFDAMVAFGDMICFMPSMGAPHPIKKATGIVTGFKASDGYFVTCVARQHQFEALAHLVGREDWLVDPQMSTRQGWIDHTEDIVRPAIESWARSLTKVEAARQLAEHGIAAGPSYTDTDLRADAHVRSHHMLVEVERPDAPDPIVVSGQPIRFSETPAPGHGRWPLLGQDTDNVLSTLLGLGAEDIAGLRDDRVVR